MIIKTINTLIVFALSFIYTSSYAQNTKAFPEKLISEKAEYYLRIHTMESVKSKKGTTIGLNGTSIASISLKKTDYDQLSMQEKTLSKLLDLILDNFKSIGLNEPKAVYSSDVTNLQDITTTIATANPRAPYSIIIFIGAFDKAEKKIKKGLEVSLVDYTCSSFVATSNEENTKNYYMNIGIKPLSTVLSQLKIDIK